MANLFDVENAPEVEPTELTVGGFSQWKRADLVSDYPTATHSAEYVARIANTTTEIKIAGTEASSYYLFTVNSTDSAAYTAGDYFWQLEITETSSSNVLVIERGNFTVLKDLDADNADPRIHAQVLVTKIESLLSGKADSDVSNYSIAGRSLTKLSFTELVEARDYYRKEVVKYENEALLKRGKSNNATIKVRF